MARDERAELAAGVPGRAQDSDGNFMHGECIYMQLRRGQDLDRPARAASASRAQASPRDRSTCQFIADGKQARAPGDDSRAHRGAATSAARRSSGSCCGSVGGTSRRRRCLATCASSASRACPPPTAPGIRSRRRRLRAGMAIPCSRRCSRRSSAASTAWERWSCSAPSRAAHSPSRARSMPSPGPNPRHAGGDDTILLICRSTAARERLVRRIRTLGGPVGPARAPSIS